MGSNENESFTLKKGTELQGGKYVIERVLGNGGFGITYLAKQSGLGRVVALKEFYIKGVNSRDSYTERIVLMSSVNNNLWIEFKDKFLKEARTIASLSHPGIIAIYDVFEENGTAYYSMEYISNGSLKDEVRANGKMDEGCAIDLVRKVADALGYIHSKNILHLDIKPDNIMMRDKYTPVIIDFGISKRYNSDGNQTSIMQTGRSCGYAPFEQYEQGGLNSFTPATDIYSLSATLFFLLAGVRPPEPNYIYISGLPEISGVSNDAMDAIRRGMAIRRAERPQTVYDFINILPNTSSNKPDVEICKEIRTLILSLEESGSHKEAYNRCLENIRNGVDVEFSKSKATELVKAMRKKNSRSSFWMVILAIAITVLVTILSISIQ